MAADNSNSTMEMGTSDQVLVASKKKKRTTYIIGGIVMVVIIALIITAVVLLSGNEGDNDGPGNTTEGPTTITPITEPSSPDPTEPPVTDPPTSTDEPPVTDPPTEEPPTEPPPPELPPLELEELNNGVFSPSTFTASWVSGTEFLYQDETANVLMHNSLTGNTQTLLPNSSEVMQQPSIRSVERSADGTTLVVAHAAVPVFRHSFLAQYSAMTLPNEDAATIGPTGVTNPFLQNFVWGPSGTSMAFVYLNNVYYKPSLAAASQQISTTGVINVLYHGIPDWVYEEEVFSSAVALWFSPGGTNIAYATFDDTNVRVMNVPHYGVPGSLEDQYTRHNAIRYPKPGSINPTVSVTIYNLATSTPTLISAPNNLNEPILLSVKFVNEETIAVVWANRVQNQIQVNLCTQGAAGLCTLIFSHSEPSGWIENNPLIFNAAGTSFVTVLPQTVNGSPWKQVVQVSAGDAGAEWTLQGRSNTANTVSDILAWTTSDVVWYKATAVEDSAQQHLYSVNAEGTVSCFTCGIQHSTGSACLYNDASFSADNSVVTVTCAGPGVPEVYLYTVAGARLSVWEENAALSQIVKERSMPAVTRLSVPVQEGLPNAEVLVQHPANAASLTNVPLIINVYGGPGSSSVTHSWFVDWGTSLVSRWNVAVAHIDGRGSGLKGVNNLFALNRQLGTIEIEDQITVTRYLQENLPYIDSNRTCIWGWSYGGYASTLALVRGQDVFRCAIAVAPVTDWRNYDTIYTERYMDTPANNAVGYTRSSLLNPESVEALRDKRYFLVHGTQDDNVHYQHAMLFSRALQLGDVYFHQMSYTDEDHGLVGVRPHLYHGMEKFLQENML